MDDRGSRNSECGSLTLRGKKQTVEVPIWEKANLTIKEAAEYSNIGINRLDEMTKQPNCPFVLYIGRKKLIKRKAFEKYLSTVLEL